jgi:hypothetical protein
MCKGEVNEGKAFVRKTDEEEKVKRLSLRVLEFALFIYAFGIRALIHLTLKC